MGQSVDGLSFLIVRPLGEGVEAENRINHLVAQQPVGARLEAEH